MSEPVASEEPSPPAMRPVTRSARELAERFDALRWMPELSLSQIELLARHLEEWEVDAGHTILVEGGSESRLCFVIEGEVEIRKQRSSEEPRTLIALGPGKAFGEVSLVDGRPHSASVVAVRPCRLLLLSRPGLDELTLRAPKLALMVVEKIAKLLCERLRRTSGILVEYL